MTIKVKSNWIYQGKQQQGCTVDVPQKVIDDIKKAIPPVEFEEVKAESKSFETKTIKDNPITASSVKP